MKILLALAWLFLFMPLNTLAGNDGQTAGRQGAGADGHSWKTGDGGAVEHRVVYLRDVLLLNGEQAEDLKKILSVIDRNSQSRRSSMGSGRGGHGKHSGRSESQIDREQVEDRNREIHASIQAVLNEDQIARYNSLVEQEREWWLDPQLMQMDEMLNLSLSQCRRIHPVLRRSRLRIRALRENATDSGDRSAMEKLRAEMKESNEVLLEFLDEKQQERWRQHVDELKKQMEDSGSHRGMGGRGGAGRGRHGGGVGGRRSGED